MMNLCADAPAAICLHIDAVLHLTQIAVKKIAPDEGCCNTAIGGYPNSFIVISKLIDLNRGITI